MKLYSLSLQAIGPFAGSHTIDLAALGQSGLFLLEGPTGAGKSTIIDAIVFALYGDLAGESASKERLHSHHAERGIEPFVDLIFEVDSGVYRVRRSPAHQRPKRRGEGTTTQNEAVTLSRLTDIDAPDAGVPISTSTQEVGHEIAELVGLRKDQFLQTVVLPQGEFARFLRSNGEDRKELLQTIFRTEIYEQMTKTLVELRREANARTETARHDVRQAIAVLASAADIETDDLLTLDGLVDDELVSGILAAAALESTTAATAAQQTSATRREAEQSLAVAEQLARALKRRSELLTQQTELVEQQPDVLVAAEELKVGQRAAVVAGAVRAHDVATAAVERVTVAHEEAASALGVALSTEECAERDEALGSRLAHLDAFGVMEAGFASRDRQIGELDEKVALIEVQIEEIDKRMTERPILREALEDARDEQLGLVSGLGDAQTSVDRMATALKSAVVAESKQALLAAARTELTDLSGTAHKAVAAHAELRLRRLQGMAGELASDLVDGSPCSVCGATEHPRPAERADDHPDDESIEAADLTAKKAEGDVVTARSAVDRLEAEVAAARESAGGVTVDDAQAAHDDAVVLLGSIKLAADRVDELDKELKKLETAELDDERQRGRAAAELSQATAQLTLLTAALATDRAQIAEQLGDEAETLAQLTSQLTAERRTVQRYASTMREQHDAAERLVEAAQTLTGQLAEHEFADSEAVRAALIPADQADHLQRLVSAHHQQVAVVEAGLASAEIAALTGTEDPRLEELRLAATEAQIVDQQAAATAGTAQARAAKVGERREALSVAQTALDAVSADAAAVIRMAEVADGTSRANLKSLTLGTYVLMRRFEDVVAAANARLGPMSDGRYQLRATDEKERGARGRRTGLALAVFDAETGQEREPRTLSGGETFYVSLCLALGLADVVTGEAGGIEIGTLFVDEGFGSLDPQTLDDVMSELTALARGGRVIGIVSHVEDLKLRVADRIEVRRLDDGSSTLTVKV